MWQSLGPVLDLAGWIALAVAGAFLVWAAIQRRGLRRWTSMPCRIEVMDGQPCVVWISPEGTAHAHPLGDDDGTPPGQVFFRSGRLVRWRLSPPVDNTPVLRRTGYVLLGVCLVANVLGLVGAAA